MTPLYVFAEIEPKSEYLELAIEAIQNIVAPTRNEDGCHRFNVFENRTIGQIYLFEEWTDQAALDRHYAQPYTMAVFESYEKWLAKDPVIKKFSAIGSE